MVNKDFHITFLQYTIVLISWTKRRRTIKTLQLNRIYFTVTRKAASPLNWLPKKQQSCR